MKNIIDSSKVETVIVNEMNSFQNSDVTNEETTHLRKSSWLKNKS